MIYVLSPTDSRVFLNPMVPKYDICTYLPVGLIKVHLSTRTVIILSMCVTVTVVSLSVELSVWQILVFKLWIKNNCTDSLLNMLNNFRCHDFLNSAFDNIYKI